MQGLRGRFINLRESTKRREKIEIQLGNLNIRKYYERFNAIRGELNEAKERGLNTGELGLWKSWLEILKHEKEICRGQNMYLHIIEDDCILNRELYRFMQNSHKINTKFDIIATDMYVNPSIYKALKEKCRLNKSNLVVEIIRQYTGCTSSMIIHSSRIEKVYAALTKEFEGMEKLIPIDNYLLRCDRSKDLNIGITIPFLSSVREESIGRSTIQVVEQNNTAINLTQEFCSILRKQLSISNKGEREIERLIEIYAELIRLEDRKETGISNLELIIETILDYSELKNILKYKYRPNLINEEGNPQNI